jgi:hypothetical protein
LGDKNKEKNYNASDDSCAVYTRLAQAAPCGKLFNLHPLRCRTKPIFLALLPAIPVA